MADPTSLAHYADAYPILAGWCRCDDNYTTEIILNGPLLSLDEKVFPLQARLRIFIAGRLAAEYFTPEIAADRFLTVSLNECLADKTCEDAYFEVNVFSRELPALGHNFFNEVWGNVYSQDGWVGVNFPLLIGRGADPSMIDSHYLYYPGLWIDADYDAAILLMNHNDFENNYELWVYRYDGAAQQYCQKNIQAKSLQRFVLSELFPGLEKFLGGQPGLLVYRFSYKMNAYLQTIGRNTNSIVGMDHLGLLFGDSRRALAKPQLDRQRLEQERLQNPLVCYCRGISLNEIVAWKQCGKNLAQLHEATGAGTVCVGCVGDLEAIFSNETPH